METNRWHKSINQSIIINDTLRRNIPSGHYSLYQMVQNQILLLALLVYRHEKLMSREIGHR